MNKTADNLYDDCIDIIWRKMQGDTDIKDSEYQVARELIQTVFISIRFDREGKEFPDHIKDD